MKSKRLWAGGSLVMAANDASTVIGARLKSNSSITIFRLRHCLGFVFPVPKAVLAVLRFFFQPLADLAMKLLDKEIYINWPHLTIGRISAVSSGEEK